MEKEKDNINTVRKKFNEQFGNLTEREILLEMLFTQNQTIDKLEKVRSNTSSLVWWLIVIPIIAGIIILVTMG
jgi:hypothetical protein